MTRLQSVASMVPDQYNVENLRQALSNPRLFVGELNRVGSQLNRMYYRRFREQRGVDIMAQDWDNLLLLDGCRYDLYAERTPFEGPLERRRSVGSDSWEFLRTHFVDETHHDTVYVTANPHAYRLPSNVFHYHHNLLDDAWDTELETVLPGTVREATSAAHERFPNKRLLVHFMQPHFPFIGELGRCLGGTGIDRHLDDDGQEDELPIWEKVRYGYVDRESVWSAYTENLDIVLDTVRKLVQELPGRTVITTDHGNLAGDRLRPIPTRGYGHPRWMYVPELVEIPWQVLEGDERRAVRSAPPANVENADPEEDIVQRRLRDLGYRP